ncbi:MULTISPECIES: MFS transporter [Acinetobacter]|uniref:Aromatic acid/H+ symport family MFS transporter n=1 Tax=Acinetobacter haemolyticus TaxID=29430 RepID=A0AAJ2YWR8_ACIHA|nr:MFS transporter [Acinetobacter haemolyticus]AZN69100.1 MFS transporter [Acinetobacter haemolyticus]MCU4386557.1 MFS transporter [Acinetobacter haemolyticus]NAR19559.1 aromatic acid/H+ symport family MFS transporter [Acinetobacter haemolyticus]NAR29955.1 aromatic acid/H+ symport family MFS transporter [Acinetobacter haemolyticus]NAR34734.1 aromatic acid/H+ symport family MFS transporter [Acinetobacter haemolyticus]
MTTSTVNVNAVIDEAKFTPFHWSILLWCLLIIIFDGYDLVIYGVVLPLLMQEWSLTSVQAGMLASTALCGMMFGAMLFGALADKIGRKNVILICVTFFSGFTFLGAFASNPFEFGILRFLAGLGIGGVMPNLVALTSEYAPKRIRSTLVGTMFSGYAIGGILSALIGSYLVESQGWQIMFLIAGIPLLLLPVMWKFLPESLTFLVKTGKTEQAQSIVQKISPQQAISSNTRLTLNEENIPTGSSVKGLFQQGRAFNTLMFWVLFFMCLLMVYALSSWLPKLMLAAGYSLGKSILFLFALNVGAMIGSIGGGILSDKFHLKPVIMGMLMAGVVALIGLGFNSPAYVLYGLVTVAGAATIGTSILLYSYVAQYYPLSVRSTGIGCASGVGRIGAIVGPILTGLLLTLNLPHTMNFVMISIPAMIAICAILSLKRHKFDEEQQVEEVKTNLTESGNA